MWATLEAKDHIMEQLEIDWEDHRQCRLGIMKVRLST